MSELIRNISSGYRVKGEKGFILISTFIFMVTLVIIIATYIAFVSADMRNSGFQIENARAFYVAESGINKAIWYLINTAPDDSVDGSWRTTSFPAAPGPDPTDPKLESFAGGTYTIWVETSGEDILITSIGEVSNIRRVIQQTVVVAGGNATSVADSWRESS